MARQAGQPSAELERWLFEVLKMVTDSRLIEEKTSGESCILCLLILFAVRILVRRLGTHVFHHL